ncbi:zfyve28 [Symbiodinium necroappetens]|uniref:Zfyve28 protein n=1 Tax=Symbiodinium necroappetens TaxID=1628268 RepID=A0A813A4B3_9DINO|nr:zfyve28 [Symbiodinium necroappetens]
MSSTSTVEWVDNSAADACMSCHARFGVMQLRRKHHCRRCGQVVCRACSSAREIVPEYHPIKPQRATWQADKANHTVRSTEHGFLEMWPRQKGPGFTPKLHLSTLGSCLRKVLESTTQRNVMNYKDRAHWPQLKPLHSHHYQHQSIHPHPHSPDHYHDHFASAASSSSSFSPARSMLLAIISITTTPTSTTTTVIVTITAISITNITIMIVVVAIIIIIIILMIFIFIFIAAATTITSIIPLVVLQILVTSS